jgi:hypothetical protein
VLAALFLLAATPAFAQPAAADERPTVTVSAAVAGSVLQAALGPAADTVAGKVAAAWAERAGKRFPYLRWALPGVPPAGPRLAVLIEYQDDLFNPSLVTMRIAATFADGRQADMGDFQDQYSLVTRDEAFAINQPIPLGRRAIARIDDLLNLDAARELLHDRFLRGIPLGKGVAAVGGDVCIPLKSGVYGFGPQTEFEVHFAAKADPPATADQSVEFVAVMTGGLPDGTIRAKIDSWQSPSGMPVFGQLLAGLVPDTVRVHLRRYKFDGMHRSGTPSREP